MKRTLMIFVACASVGLTFAPAGALGQGSGNSGADEYTEDVPGGNGNGNGNGNGSETGGDPAPGGSGSTLTPGQEAALQAEGADGAEAASLANQTGPGNRGDGSDARGDGSGAGAGTGDGSGAGAGTGAGAGDGSDASTAGGGGSAFEDVVEAVTGSDSDGMGILLPIVLIVGLLAAVGVFAVRRFRQEA